MAGTIPDTMSALVKRKEGEGYELEKMAVPEPKGDEVLIQVQRVSICGSDISLYNWNSVAQTIATVPFIPGHEATGLVVKAGPNATLKVGQRVAVENHFFCGNCYQCKHNRGDICKNMGQYGHGKKTMHGGFSEYSIISSKYCYQLKSNISPEAAVLLEPVGVAHNAVEQLEVGGEDVLILGCGPIGLLAANIAKVMGAKRVFSVDIDEERLKLARDMGADVTINPSKHNLLQEILNATDGDGVGRVAEMTGAAPMVNSSFSMLRKGGQIVLVGLPKQPLHVENVLTDVVFKSLTMKTIHGRRIYHTWEECERMVADGKVKVEKVISHQFPMSKFEEAFKTLFSGKACKIIIDPKN